MWGGSGEGVGRDGVKRWTLVGARRVSDSTCWHCSAGRKGRGVLPFLKSVLTV